jgi:YidC/Oxa1 family membrane protein insertase
MPLASLHTALSSLADGLITWLHTLGLGWGVAIIAATFLVRLLVAPFAYRQIRTMATFRALGEDVKVIREHYGDDLQGMSGAMEELYKQNNFHPFNFFLPALLQAPFFASVFFYLNSSGFKSDVGGESGFLFVRSLTEATSVPV